MAAASRNLPGLLRVSGKLPVRLRDRDARRTLGWQEQHARAELARLGPELTEMQYKMYADGRFGVLVVLQAVDSGGKDSTIRHVFAAFNPQGCTVRAFKAPSREEQRHDYLWRVHQHVPARGEIVVFNRSHYEEVLIARVDRLVARRVWQARYAQINDFERMLDHCDIRLVKIFLHLSKDEQRRRLEERIHERRKQWKFESGDLAKRRQWRAYQAAYTDMLERCNTAQAPWYVVPADRKWLRDLAVAQILRHTLKSLPLRFPAPRFDPRRQRVR